MKIVVILHKKRKKGGAVLQILNIVSTLRQMGHRILIFSLDTYDKSQNPLRGIFNSISHLKSLLNHFNPEIILTSDPFFTTISAHLSNENRVPVVLRIGAVFDSFYAARITERLFGHGSAFPVYHILKILLYQLSIPVLQKVSRVIFNSQFLKELYPQSLNSVVIHNGVEVSSEVRIRKPSKKIKLIFTGRIEPRKSIELIIDALQELSNRNFEFSLSFVGNLSFHPRYWNMIKRKIDKADLWSNLIFYGDVDTKNLPSLLKKHDILLFSTDSRNFPITEGLPNVILEGMASGLAIIATDVAGVHEIVNPNNGIIVEPDHLKFAEAIEFLSKNPDKLKKMKVDNIRKSKKNFSLTLIAERYLEVLESQRVKSS